MKLTTIAAVVIALAVVLSAIVACDNHEPAPQPPHIENNQP